MTLDMLREGLRARAAMTASKRAGPGDDDDEVPIGDPPDDEGGDWDDDEEDEEDEEDDEEPLQATAYCAAASPSPRHRGTMAPSSVRGG
ncbi:MAG TPA: hypothetical protein VF059_14250 [Casimicrobiaceae bacterium]